MQKCGISRTQRGGNRCVALVARRPDRVEALVLRTQSTRGQIQVTAAQLGIEDVEGLGYAQGGPGHQRCVVVAGSRPFSTGLTGQQGGGEVLVDRFGHEQGISVHYSRSGHSTVTCPVNTWPIMGLGASLRLRRDHYGIEVIGRPSRTAGSGRGQTVIRTARPGLNLHEPALAYPGNQSRDGACEVDVDGGDCTAIEKDVDGWPVAGFDVMGGKLYDFPRCGVRAIIDLSDSHGADTDAGLEPPHGSINMNAQAAATAPAPVIDAHRHADVWPLLARIPRLKARYG